MFKLPYIPTADGLIDKAFRQGSKEAKKTRSTRKPRGERLLKSEERRVKIVGRIIEGELNSIVKNFPSYDQLPLFYRHLLDVTVDKDRYKKSLGAVHWCAKRAAVLRDEALRGLKGGSDVSKSFLGRASSLVRQIKSDLDFLGEVKGVLKSFPAVEDVPTLVVAGYPNVGKSTFVRNLTGSKIEVKSYPFTTKSILVGYRNVGYVRCQIIDSPGLLDRLMGERNKIELQAILALQYLADAVLFIVDPLLDVGKQFSLFLGIKNSFESDFFVAMNKIDVANEGDVSSVRNVFHDYPVFEFCANDVGDCERLFAVVYERSLRGG